jgi:chaperonin GroES
MAITPLYDKVVIRPLISDQTTSGGIVIPGTADNSDRGVVVAVGEGHILRDGSIRPLRVKVGDIDVPVEQVTDKPKRVRKPRDSK